MLKTPDTTLLRTVGEERAALDLAAAFTLQSLLTYCLVSAAILLLLPQHLPQTRFGNANRVTLLRAVGISLIAGLLGAAETVGRYSWLWFGLALATLLLDCVDGWLARRQGTASPFGARFDMELDALFVLVLALLVWQSGKAGGWVLSAGLLRYGFIAGGWLWPQLRRPLPPSKRRQTVCVIQIAVLIACLTPVFSGYWSQGLAAVALALLLASFLLDVVWLLLAPAGLKSHQHHFK